MYIETVGQVNIFTRGITSPLYYVAWVRFPRGNKIAAHQFALSEPLPYATGSPCTWHRVPVTSLQWRQCSEAPIVGNHSGKLGFVPRIFISLENQFHIHSRASVDVPWFRYTSQMANLGLYIPKGYVRVPSYHKDWQTHILYNQNLMPSSFVRSSISTFMRPRGAILSWT